MAQLSILVSQGPAGDTSASKPEDLQAIGIDHISVQVSDMERSVDFYSKVFGLKVTSERQDPHIVRLGINSALVSLHQAPAQTRIDHFALKLANFDKDRITGNW